MNKKDEQSFTTSSFNSEDYLKLYYNPQDSEIGFRIGIPVISWEIGKTPKQDIKMTRYNEIYAHNLQFHRLNKDGITLKLSMRWKKFENNPITGGKYKTEETNCDATVYSSLRVSGNHKIVADKSPKISSINCSHSGFSFNSIFNYFTEGVTYILTGGKNPFSFLTAMLGLASPLYNFKAFIDGYEPITDPLSAELSDLFPIIKSLKALNVDGDIWLDRIEIDKKGIWFISNYEFDNPYVQSKIEKLALTYNIDPVSSFNAVRASIPKRPKRPIGYGNRTSGFLIEAKDNNLQVVVPHKYKGLAHFWMDRTTSKWSPMTRFALDRRYDYTALQQSDENLEVVATSGYKLYHFYRAGNDWSHALPVPLTHKVSGCPGFSFNKKDSGGLYLVAPETDLHIVVPIKTGGLLYVKRVMGKWQEVNIFAKQMHFRSCTLTYGSGNVFEVVATRKYSGNTYHFYLGHDNIWAGPGPKIGHPTGTAGAYQNWYTDSIELVYPHVYSMVYRLRNEFGQWPHTTFAMRSHTMTASSIAHGTGKEVRDVVAVNTSGFLYHTYKTKSGWVHSRKNTFISSQTRFGRKNFSTQAKPPVRSQNHKRSISALNNTPLSMFARPKCKPGTSTRAATKALRLLTRR